METTAPIHSTKDFNLQRYALLFSKFWVLLAAFVLPISTSLTSISFALAVVGLVISGEYKYSLPQILKNPIVNITLALLGLYLIGMSYSYVEPSSALHSLKKVFKLAYIPLLMPLFVDYRVRKYSLVCFLAAMALTSVLAVLKMYGGLEIGMKYSAAAVFKSHIQTNFLMAFAAFVLAHVYLNVNKYRSYIGAGLAFSLFYIWFMSAGRTGYVVCLALCFLFFMQVWRWRGVGVAVLISALLFAVAFFAPTEFKQRIHAVNSDVMAYQEGNADTSIGQRVEFAKNSLRLIAKKPIFGWGTGSFAKLYADNVEATGNLITTNPHNEYLLVTVQLGAIGLALLLLLFATIWINSFNLSKDLRFLAQAVVVSIAVGCLANSWLMDTTEGYFFAYFIALCFAPIAIARRHSEPC